MILVKGNTGIYKQHKMDVLITLFIVLKFLSQHHVSSVLSNHLTTANSTRCFYVLHSTDHHDYQQLRHRCSIHRTNTPVTKPTVSKECRKPW